MVTTNPNQLYQQIAQMPVNQPTAFDKPYQQAVQNFNQATNSQFVLPTVLKSYLGGISPQFTQNKEQVLQQFSDPNSALYISNPFTRLQAAQNAAGVQKQAYSEILGNVQNLMGLGVSQQQQKVSALGAQLTAAQQAQKDKLDALQRQFQNSLSLQANNRANANAGDGKKIKYDISYQNEALGVPGGMRFTKNDVAVSPYQYAQENGVPINNLLQGSPNKGDQQFVTKYQEIMARANNGENITQDYKDLINSNRHIYGIRTDQEFNNFIKNLGY